MAVLVPAASVIQTVAEVLVNTELEGSTDSSCYSSSSTTDSSSGTGSSNVLCVYGLPAGASDGSEGSENRPIS
jgi:hypothetical protein